jgi:fucose 4-O-acetylase-like acetyltransferase
MKSAEGEAGNAASRSRLLFVERAKGLAILFVVFGHVAQIQLSPSHTWYSQAKRFIYTFHMPLFLMLSGIVFFHVASHLKWGADYWRFLRGRADRLLIPFFGFALLVVLGKSFAGTVFGVEVPDPVDNMISGFVASITNSPNNPAFSIWYLLVLFFYCAVTPVIFRLSFRNIYLLLGLALIAHFVHIGTEFYADRTLNYYVFFVLGGVLVTTGLIFNSAFGYAALASLVAVLGSLFFYESVPAPRLFYGVLVSAMVLWLMLREVPLTDSALRFLGSRSMIIYLLNTVGIGVLAVLFAPLRYRGEPEFVLYVLLLFVGGTLGPILVREIVARIPHLAPATKYIF